MAISMPVVCLSLYISTLYPS